MFKEKDPLQNTRRIIIDSNNDECQVQDDGIVRTRYRHYLVKQGKLFNISKIFSELVNDAKGEILIECDANHNLMNYLFLQCEGEWHFESFRLPNVTNNGTELGAINMNIANNNAINTNFFHTPTVSGVGTKMMEMMLGGRKSSGGVTFGDFWLYKKGENYLLRLTNKSGNTASASISMEVFEN